MAQQARPNVMGHMLDSRPQLMACSSVVVMTLSSNRPSSQPILFLHLTQNTTRTLSDARQLSGSSCTGRGSWLLSRHALLRGHAPHPVEIAALPQVGEADQQHA